MCAVIKIAFKLICMQSANKWIFCCLCSTIIMFLIFECYVYLSIIKFHYKEDLTRGLIS